MKKTLGKALSLFLCVIMLATMAIGSVTSYAYDIEYTDEYEYKIGNSTIYYTIENNEITISDCREDSFGELEIPEKINNIPVRYIGNKAFDYCSDLTIITIPNSVASIGEFAFHLCTELTTVIISNNVTSIGKYSFFCCRKLTTITIPNSVTIVGEFAFSDCTSLTSVTVPDSVLNIGEDAFYLVNNVVYFGKAKGSPWGAKAHNGYVENGLVYNDKSKSEFLGCSSAQKGNIVLPESVTSIGDNAFFYCAGLTSITIPNSIESIGNFAFYCCNGATSITIPDSVSYIKYDAFRLVNNVIYSGKAKGSPWGAKAHNGYAENGLVYNDKSKTEILGCSSVIKGDLVLPDGVTSIGDYAFLACNNLTSVTIQNSVKSIGCDAFSFCSGLTNIIIPNSVTSIGDWAFFQCTGLTNVTIPSNVTKIGDHTFAECTGLTRISIPNNIKNVGSSAFCDCTGLISITIPNSVTSIEDFAFWGCTSLTSVHIPDSVTNIGSDAFYECDKLASIDVSPQNKHYCSDNGILFDIDKKTLIKYPDAKKGYSYLIPDSVNAIDRCAFSNNQNITEIVISDNLEIIRGYAFRNCQKIKAIKNGNMIKKIEVSAFFDCQNLENIELGDRIESIGGDAFKNTAFYNNYSNWSSDGLLYFKNYLLASEYSTSEEYKPCNSTIKIKDGTVLIADSAFWDNHSIVEVSMPDSLIYIGEDSFSYCNNLKHLKFGSGLKEIGEDAFGSCPNIQNFYIGTNDRFYTDNAGALLEKFQYSENDWEYSEYPGTVKRLIAYPNGSPSTSYTVSKDVVKIDEDAFVGCSNLKQILVENGNKNYASYKGAIYGLNDNYYSDIDEIYTINAAYLIQIPAVGNRYSIPEKITVNGVEYTIIRARLRAPFQSNPNNPTILDVPKSIYDLNAYTSLDYICFEGTEEDWYNGIGRCFYGNSKILFEAYGKNLEDLIEIDPDILPEEHTITITENYTSACGIVAETSNRTFNEPVHIAVNEAFTSAEQTAIKAIADGKDAVAYNIAIVNEAGGAITNLNGNKVTLKIPESMISSNGWIDTLKIYHITSTDPVLGVQKEVFSTNPTSDIEKPISVEVIYGMRYFCFDVTSWSPFVFEYTQADEPFIPGESNIISIDLDAETLNMNYKSTATLNPIVVGTGDVEYDIKFESSNPKVVSVDENGKVTALKKGNANITVTVTDEYGNSLSDTCKVNVNYTWWQWIIRIVLFGWIWY